MTTDNLFACDLKGFCSIRLCWQFFYDVANTLEIIHASGKSHGAVDLNHVKIEGEHFGLMEGTNDSAMTSDIWSLAASAMELVLGSPIFNGEGESSQKPNTPIPTLPYPNTDQLNMLLHSCLDTDIHRRPSAAEIKRIAKEELEKIPSSGRKLRVLPSVKAQGSLEKTDLQWPERMVAGVAHSILILLMITLPNLVSFGQTTLDEHEEIVTSKLLNAVLVLRQGDTIAWKTAYDELAKQQSQFTLMNELKDERNDCSLVTENVQSFGVNRIVADLKMGMRVQNTGQELLDGSDTRFKYSLFEKGIKKGCTSTYTLKGRLGKQVFLIVPFAADQPYISELRKSDGTLIAPSGKDTDGITYYFVNTETGPSFGETLMLKISNKDLKNNASFVIINHNYRNKP